ncbi:annexin a7-like [Neofusicoccum parvum]|uniref:Annexin a7-like n=1 Tax=Neofusicoccum parvum TaxID=310453 RepID=A0ACB5SP98_9PEZI|nr:annexin a7-like [Neofusicoccum parvum]
MQHPDDQQPRQRGRRSGLNAQASSFAPGGGDGTKASSRPGQAHGSRPGSQQHGSYQPAYQGAHHMANPYGTPYANDNGQGYSMGSSYQGNYIQDPMGQAGMAYGTGLGSGYGMSGNPSMVYSHQSYSQQSYSFQSFGEQPYGAQMDMNMGGQSQWGAGPVYQPPPHESVPLTGRHASPLHHQSASSAGHRTPLSAQQTAYPPPRPSYPGQDSAVPGPQPISRGSTPAQRGQPGGPRRPESSQPRRGNQPGLASRGHAANRGPPRHVAGTSAPVGEGDFPSLGSQSAAQDRGRLSPPAPLDADAQLASQLSSTRLDDRPRSSRSGRRPNYVPFSQHPDPEPLSTRPPPPAAAATSQPPTRRYRNRNFRLSISEVYRGKIVYIDKSPSIDYGDHPAIISSVHAATRTVRFWKLSSFRECRGFGNKYAGYRNGAARRSHEKGWVLIWDGGATEPHHDTPVLRLGAGKVLGGPTYVDVVEQKELPVDCLSKLSKERRFPELWLEEDEMRVMEEYADEYNRTKPDFSARRRQLDGADGEDFDQDLGVEGLDDDSQDADDEADEE